MKKHFIFSTVFTLGSFFLALSQPTTNKKNSEYKFTIVKTIETTPVQN
jgi:hypothetical protein